MNDVPSDSFVIRRLQELELELTPKLVSAVTADVQAQAISLRRLWDYDLGDRDLVATDAVGYEATC